MPDDLVMRSVYLPVQDDTLLRQLAHELEVSKNALIRAAVAAALQQWQADPASLKNSMTGFSYCGRTLGD